MSETLLEARNVSVSFGGLKALDGVDCVVGEGEIVGIIGPNGAGKTTLLNALSRFVRTNSDCTLQFRGEDLTRRRAYQVAALGIGRTFQAAELASRDTLLDNVMTGGHLRFMAGKRPWASRKVLADVRADAEHLLRTFAIERWAELRARDAPYPIQKRAQICRALLSKPSLLLLDEPAAGITAEEKKQMQDALLALHRDTGVALLVIEHDVNFLTSMCQRFLALNFGRMLASGPVAEVVRHPAVIESYLGASDDE